MKQQHISRSTNKVWWILLTVLCLLRLLSLGAYPLADTTEARYGEIARLMVTTGDWITPQIDKEVPFWGKPPLSFWLAAVSMQIFGVNEFGARLPSFLLGIVVSVVVWFVAARQRDKNYGLAATLILNSMLFFWVSSGAVMTDQALLASTTLCLAAFWFAVQKPRRTGGMWGYLFFAGLAAGLLAKGPVALVLVGLPTGTWTLATWKWQQVRSRLPWEIGLLLTALLSVPWYWLAEMKTPGFLQYFLVGEHLYRFLVPGWQGDLYGSAHLQPRGMIWLYWLACSLPWSIVLLWMMFCRKFRASMVKLFASKDEWMIYLLSWAIWPMIFFTMARNILPAYVLPGLPPLALLLPLLWRSFSKRAQPASVGIMTWPVSIMLLVFAISYVVVAHGYGPSGLSQKKYIALFHEKRTDEASQLIYLFDHPYSARFYSRGMAGFANTVSETEQYFSNGITDFFAVPVDRLAQMPGVFQSRISSIGLVNQRYLLQEKQPQTIALFNPALKTVQ